MGQQACRNLNVFVSKEIVSGVVLIFNNEHITTIERQKTIVRFCLRGRSFPDKNTAIGTAVKWRACRALRTRDGDLVKPDVFDRIVIRMGDITLLEVDAVVNAANSTLLGGGGVDGMIHWAAGSGLLEECRKIGWCPAGEARITGAYNLPARHVIHAVGPVYNIDGDDSPRLLSSCYISCLHLAAENGAKTISFPAVSCGAYGYPVREACRIALDTTLRFLETHDCPEKVIFVLYSLRDYEAYREYYGEKREGARDNGE